jgi:hypothetical protein
MKSVSTGVVQGTREAACQLDDTKDYVYSTWEDNRLRSFLTEKGALAKDSADKKRAEAPRTHAGRVRACHHSHLGGMV